MIVLRSNLRLNLHLSREADRDESQSSLPFYQPLISGTGEAVRADVSGTEPLSNHLFPKVVIRVSVDGDVSLAPMAAGARRDSWSVWVAVCLPRSPKDRRTNRRSTSLHLYFVVSVFHDDYSVSAVWPKMFSQRNGIAFTAIP